MKPSFWGKTFFSKCSKNFSIGLMIMFKVCRRCLQCFPLRWKKNYERTIHASKYIQKKADPPLTPLRGGVNSFNATLTRFGATWSWEYRAKISLDFEISCVIFWEYFQVSCLIVLQDLQVVLTLSWKSSTSTFSTFLKTKNHWTSKRSIFGSR